MYQHSYHDLALIITDLSRCAADELEQKETIYQEVLRRRDTAAADLQKRLPSELQTIWNKYQVLAGRYHFMEQELQFFKGYCSYPVLMGPLDESTFSPERLQYELLKKFR